MHYVLCRFIGFPYHISFFKVLCFLHQDENFFSQDEVDLEKSFIRNLAHFYDGHWRILFSVNPSRLHFLLHKELGLHTKTDRSF